MLVRFECQFCGKSLKADSSNSGIQVKCPGCEGLVTIPEMSDSAPGTEIEANSPLMTGPRKGPANPSSRKKQVQCQGCGEMILATDDVCPECGHETRRFDDEKFPIADPGKRLVGVLIDHATTFLALAPGMGIMVIASPQPEEEPSPLALIGAGVMFIGLVVLFIINLYLLINHSQSVGKFLLKMQIVDYNTMAPAGFIECFILRVLVNGVICILPCVGFFYFLVDSMFVFSDEHRCLHDRLSGTLVIDISGHGRH